MSDLSLEKMKEDLTGAALTRLKWAVRMEQKLAHGLVVSEEEKKAYAELVASIKSMEETLKELGLV